MRRLALAALIAALAAPAYAGAAGVSTDQIASTKPAPESGEKVGVVPWHPTPVPVATTNGGVFPNPFPIVTNIFTQLAAYFNADLVDAESLSVSIPTLQDGNGHDCAVAGQTFASVLQAHPVVVSGHPATDLEGLRLLVAGAHQLCANNACRAVFSEADNAVATLSIGGLTVPAFETICAKLPSVALVPPALPVVTPAPTPAPSPSPSPSPSPVTP